MIRTEHNIETNEVKEINLTNAELKAFEKQWANQAAFNEQEIAEAEAKATQKAALLERLGITEDEARLLLG
jgi:hypothetical protein